MFIVEYIVGCVLQRRPDQQFDRREVGHSALGGRFLPFSAFCNALTDSSVIVMTLASCLNVLSHWSSLESESNSLTNNGLLANFVACH